MKPLVYNLAGGNKVLHTEQGNNRDCLFQVVYSGVLSAGIKIGVWVSTDSNGPFSEVPETQVELSPGETTKHIALTGVGIAYLQFRVIAPNGSAGKIEQIGFKGGFGFPFP